MNVVIGCETAPNFDHVYSDSRVDNYSNNRSSSFLVALRGPQLEDDDEGDDEELQHRAEDPQRHVLDGDHLRRLVLEEERPAALRESADDGVARFLI